MENDAEGEYVELQNMGTSTVIMANWTLRDAKDTIYTFPVFALISGTKVKVWVKSGTDTATDLYWGA